jgi:hypothetical protein
MSAAQGEAMPIHRWTRVTARAFHDFHQTWLVEIKRALNGGILPPGFYALAERIAGGLGPKVLTLAGPVLDFIWRGIPQLIGGCSVLLSLCSA